MNKEVCTCEQNKSNNSGIATFYLFNKFNNEQS